MSANTPIRHPLIELMARYRAVFRAAWDARDELAGPKRLQDEAAFLPAALSLQDTPAHPAPRRAAYAIMTLFIVALVWSIFGKVDIVAVAQGRIVVSDRTKTIQPLERSVIKRILVKDGDAVQAGQPLLELDPTIAQADRATADEQVKSAQSDSIRARALLNALNARALKPQAKYSPDWPSKDVAAAQEQLLTEWGDINAKLAKMSAEANHRQAEIITGKELIRKLETTLPLATQRERDVVKLAEDGYMPAHTGQDRARERVEMERDLAAQRSRVVEAQAALRESESNRAAYLAEVRRTLSDRESQADFKKQQASQDQIKAAQREKLTILRAPVAGTVQQLAVYTIGGVVTDAQPLMVIVPKDAQVSAEVMLENKDVGFVREGQEALIKLEAFPYTRYGTVQAKVLRVSRDAVTDEKKGSQFPVTVQLMRSAIDVDGVPVNLQAGMNLTAEVATGKRRVIEYLLSPIKQWGEESLRER